VVIEELVALLKFKSQGMAQATAFKGVLQGIKKELSGLANAAAIAGGALATGLGAGFTAIGKGSIDAGRAFEKMQATLEVIEGSSEKAKASLDWVEDFATRTPYEVQDVTEAFVKLKGYGIDPLQGSLEAAGNAASAMGKPIMQAIEAIADAVTGENERLKEFGVKAKVAGDKVTYTWQENGKEMTKSIKNDAKSIEAALKDIFGKRFSGAMEKQSKTLDGIISNISDNFTKFKRLIADAGWYDYVKKKFTELLNKIDQMKKDGRLQRWAEDISTRLIAVSEFILRFARAIRDAGKAALDMSPNFNVLAVAVGVLLARFRPLTTAILAVVLAIEDLQAYREGDISVFGWMVKQIRELTGASEGVAEALAGLAPVVGLALLAGLKTALMWAAKAAGAFLLSTALPLLLTPPGMAVEAGAAALALIYIYRDELIAKAKELYEAGKVLGTMVKDGFLAVVDAFVEVGVTIGRNLLEGLKSMGGAIVSWFKGLFSGGISLPSFGGRGDLQPLGDAMGGLRQLGSLNNNAIKQMSSSGSGAGGTTTQTANIEVNVTNSNAAPGDIAAAVKKASVDALRSLSVSGGRPATA
jgi:hypothetical protein